MSDQIPVNVQVTETVTEACGTYGGRAASMVVGGSFIVVGAKKAAGAVMGFLAHGALSAAFVGVGCWCCAGQPSSAEEVTTLSTNVMSKTGGAFSGVVNFVSGGMTAVGGQFGGQLAPTGQYLPAPVTVNAYSAYPRDAVYPQGFYQRANGTV